MKWHPPRASRLAVLVIALPLAVLAPLAARAQSAIRITTCGTAAPPQGAGSIYMDATGNLCVAASFSGTLTVATQATAATTPPTYTAGINPLSQNLKGGLRVQVSLAGTDIGLGQQLSAASIPVVLPSDQTVPVSGTVTAGAKTITWIAPTSASITASGTVVAAGPTTSVITNVTAAGGGTLTLNLFGGTAVPNVGIPLQPGEHATIEGQPVGTAITGICSTGTCTAGVQSGT